MKLIEKLPHLFGRNEEVPRQLIGAKIVRIGTFSREANLRGGGLGIEYIPAGSKETRRIILENDEIEMHVHSDEPISAIGV